MESKAGITNVEHIKSVSIPIKEDVKYKFIYVLSSCDERIHDDKRFPGRIYNNEFRVWNFWETQEQAIEKGIYGWNDAEAYYESGDYTHMVIEKVALNHPMPTYEMVGGNEDRIWFKFVPEEADKQFHDIRKAIVLCECPDYYKNSIGFF
jgi:hypothetical protein